MKLKFSRLLASGAVLALAAVGTAAQARSDVFWSVGINAAPGVAVGVGNAPVYVAPQPVYVAPQPVVVAPRPVYVAPAPVYYAPAPVSVYYGPGYYGHRHGHRHHHRH